MFGIGEKKKELPSGAKEKIRIAREQMEGAGGELKTGYRGKEQDDTVPVMIAVYGIACATILLLMQYRLEKGVPFRLPWPEVNRWLLAMPPPDVAGDKDLDLLIAMAVRGFAFFLLAGLVPGLVYLAQIVRGAKEDKPSLGVFWLMYALLIAGGVICYKL